MSESIYRYYVFYQTNKRIRIGKYETDFNEKALLIQSIFRGNKIRSKLNNILIKLPDDIQRIILKSVREDYYNTKRNNLIEIIINNRLLKFLTPTYSIFNIPHDLLYFTDHHNTYESYFLEINKLYSLLNKYFCIIKFNTTIKKLYNLTKIRWNVYNISNAPNEAVEFMELYKYINYTYSLDQNYRNFV